MARARWTGSGFETRYNPSLHAANAADHLNSHFTSVRHATIRFMSSTLCVAPHWTSWLEYRFSRRYSCPISPCLQASTCWMIDNLYSVVKTRRIRFSSVGFGLTMGSTAVAGFGIADLLSTLIYTLTQNQLAQVCVDTQGVLAGDLGASFKSTNLTVFEINTKSVTQSVQFPHQTQHHSSTAYGLVIISLIIFPSFI